ncbi:hypothetical protein SAMN06297251_10449 [Fulvimarina manganoxydans]|uniref:Mu-like prophage protein gp37 n=1 Tax=Fulvimarina manganoxydans TaxID=937218 RepID=A0A1W2A9T3_9HYPH|nr:hypothetical protein [Fulvimarina manganoxydans]SMC57404.1 hypothetical protein SAMN06297251_10449 [Fulvimarina manganoxydans]
MTHVNHQIVTAVREIVARDLPEFGGRVYQTSLSPWDEVSYPAAFVWGERTPVSLESRQGRLQRRQLRLRVSFEDRVNWDTDFGAAAGDLAVRLEAAVLSLVEEIPIESIELVEDAGIAVDSGTGDDGNPLTLVSSGLAFDVVYYTAEGKADAFVPA